MKNSLQLFILFFIFSFSPARGQDDYELLFVQKQYDLIIEKAAKKINTVQKNEQDYYWYAIACDKKGQTDKSISILKQGLVDFTANIKLSKLLADFYYQSGNYGQAKVLLKKYPADINCKLQLATIYEFSNHYSKAISILLDFYQQDTTNILYLKHLGNNYFKQDSIAKAIQYYQKAIRINPYDQPTVYRLAQIYLKKEAYKKSIEVCKPVLENDSLNIRFLKHTAYTYYKNRNYAPAINNFIKVISLGDSSAFVYKYLGICQLNNFAYHKGRKNLLNAFQLDSTDFKTCFFLGRAFLNSTNQSKGLYYLDLADSLIQPNAKVLVAIYQEKASIYDALKQYEKALEAQKKSYKLSDKPEYLFYIASINKRMGNKKIALSYFNRFLAECPPASSTADKGKDKGITISLQKVAQDNIAILKEELFFEGKLENK